MKLVKASTKHLGEFEKLEKEFLQHNHSLGIDSHYKITEVSSLEKNYFATELKNKLKKKDSFFYFIEDNKIFAGYIYGYIEELPKLFKLGKLGYLDKIIISKEFRGKGFASVLKDKFFEFLSKNEVELCQIHVAEPNKTTLDIYKKWGFKTDQLRMVAKV